MDSEFHPHPFCRRGSLSANQAGRFGGKANSFVKGKRIPCPPLCGHRDLQAVPRKLGAHHSFEHPFPLIRSLRASVQWPTPVLFSLCAPLIVAESFAIRQLKRNSKSPFIARPGLPKCAPVRGVEAEPDSNGVPARCFTSKIWMNICWHDRTGRRRKLFAAYCQPFIRREPSCNQKL